MRLIDADALIKFIDCGHLRNPLEMCFSERDVVDMIESRPTVSQWIPTSEKLPEEDGRYLCYECVGSGHFYIVYGFATDLRTVSKIDFADSKAGFYDHDSEYGFTEVTEFVKAWCEFPEFYKEIEDAE